MVARFVATGLVADRFAATTIAAPVLGIEQTPEPPQGMEAEVALATTATFIAAPAATAAPAAPAASAAPATRAATSTSAAVIGADPFAEGATDRPASRAAIALARTAAFAAAPSAATSMSQKSAAPGRRQ